MKRVHITMVALAVVGGVAPSARQQPVGNATLELSETMVTRVTSRPRPSAP